MAVESESTIINSDPNRPRLPFLFVLELRLIEPRDFVDPLLLEIVTVVEVLFADTEIEFLAVKPEKLPTGAVLVLVVVVEEYGLPQE